MAQKMTATFMVVLFLIGVVTLEAASPASTTSDAAADACYKDCAKYKKEDPMRFAVCEEACGFEREVRRGYTMTTRCNQFCEDAVKLKACMEPCKVIEDATKVSLVVGACYTECVRNVKDPAEFGKCKEACARADKEGPQLVRDNALARIKECNERCVNECGADVARVDKCNKTCAHEKQ